MTVEKGIFGIKYEEEEEERGGGGGLRKRWRSEVEEEEEDQEEEEMEEGNMSVMRSDLLPGRRECHMLEEHTNCLAHRTNRNGFFRQLMRDRLKRWIIPRQKSILRSLIPTWTTCWH